MLKITFDRLPRNFQEIFALDRSLTIEDVIGRDQSLTIDTAIKQHQAYFAITVDDVIAHDRSLTIQDRMFLYRAREEVQRQSNANGTAPVKLEVAKKSVVAEWHVLHDVLVAALQMLRDASPVRSGAYRDGHTLFVDGQPQDGVPTNFVNGSVIMIANPVPYSRKIEIGVTKSGRPFVVQVLPHIYDRVGKALQTKFGDIAKVTINAEPGVELPDAYSIKGVVGRSGISARYQRAHRSIKRHTHSGETLRVPALIFEAKV